MKTEDKNGKEKGGTSSGKREEEEITDLGKLKLSSFLLNALKLCETYKTRNGPNFCTTPVKGKPFLLTNSTQVSARKIGAVIWEFQHYSDSVDDMYLGGDNSGNCSYKYGDNQRVGGKNVGVNKGEGFDLIHDSNLGFESQRNVSLDHHPASATNLRRHTGAYPMQQHKSAERNKNPLKDLSPASYTSSSKMAPYNQAATPDSSVKLRRRIGGKSSCRFKISTELLKVLNRIWSLEEQHTSNMSLVKGLKTELHHTRSKIKELLKDKQVNRHEIDRLMKKISGDERIDISLQSARNELENEQNLRKRSESLHRKLARELFEVKVDLATLVKELEKEKKSNQVLEELCDEFSKSIIECASSKQKPDKGWTHHNLILQISESWLDERAQMKDLETRQPIVDKLRHEIKTFLENRQLVDPKENYLRRCSLESIPEAVTGPQDSSFSDFHGEEVSKVGPSKTSGDISTEINMLKKSDIYEYVNEQRKTGYDEEGHGSNSKPVGRLINDLLFSEGGSLTPKCKYKEVGSSYLSNNASPVRQWMTSMGSTGPKVAEVCSKMMSAKDNLLKARLQEPKSKGQRSQLKILKSSS